MKKVLQKITHASFTERPGDSGIYTGQGDYIGTIEDDHLRNDAILGLNGEIENEDEELLEYLEENDLDMDGIKELMEVKNKFETAIEKIDEVQIGLAHLAECVLLGNLTDVDDYDYIDGLVKTLDKIEQ